MVTRLRYILKVLRWLLRVLTKSAPRAPPPLLPLLLLPPPPVGVSGTGVGDAIAATLADMSVSDILMSFNVSFCGDVDPDVRSEAYPGDGDGDVE